MNFRNLIISLLLFIYGSHGFAQVATMVPADATVDDDVTIYFDATRGDQGLLDFDGDVYAHTGIITTESTSGSDWKYVVADWGTANEDVLLTREEENLYSLSFNIRDFYGIPDTETVLQLAFVFRNADGSQSARSADGSDVFVPLSVPPDTYVSHDFEAGVLTVHGTENQYRVQAWNENSIHFSVFSNEPESDSSYAVVSEPQSIITHLEVFEDRLTFDAGNLEVIIQKDPLRFEWLRDGQELIQQNAALLNGAFDGGLLDFSVSDSEHFYGTGFRAIPVDRRGYQLEFYNQAHYGYSNGASNLNISIPLLVSSENYGLFFDNHRPSFMDIASSGNQLRYSSESGVMDYFFLNGNSQADVLESYTALTGRQEMPPIWALGYIQSRYGYESQSQAEEVVEEMRASGFPMDALVLDLYWFGNTNDMGDLDWDYTRFPQPEEMMADFADQGIQTILITEPYFTLESDHYSTLAANDYFARNAEGDPFVLYGFWAGDAALLDMTNQEALDWMWQHYRNRIEQGVGGWWTDLAEPETHPDLMIHQDGSAREVHNIFNLEWQRMLHEKHAEEYPDKRLFNLSRSGWAGMQRYSAFPWSGDIQRSFAGLQAQIPAMLGMSMSGVGYMHSDIGGFTGGGQDAELYTRWMQLGAFVPVMRAHGVDVPTEPIYYDEQTQNRVRKMIDLRYEFLPYNYQLAFENSTTGVPLARPLNFYEPQNEFLSNVNDAFLWGKDVLVAPVLEDNQTSKEVVFPSGEWYDYRNNMLYQGNQSATVDAPLDELPLFIRAGSLIALSAEKLMTTQAYDSDSLQIKYYLPEAGVETTQSYYFDDGLTRGNIAENNFEIIELKGISETNDVILELEKSFDGFGLAERSMEFEVNGFGEKPGTVMVNGAVWEIAENEAFYESSEKLAFWSDDDRFRVKFPWSDTLTRITIARPTIGVDEMAREDAGFNLHKPSPNPFSEETTLKADVKNPGVYHFAITGLSGKIIQQSDHLLQKGRNRMMLSELIDANQLKPGVYFLTVKNSKGSQTVKILKVR